MRYTRGVPERVLTHFSPAFHDAGGRVLLRIHQTVLETDRPHREVVRDPFLFFPAKGGPPLRAVLIGLRPRSGHFYLKGELWIPAGSYRFSPKTKRQGGHIDILPDPDTPLRIHCGHGASPVSWNAPLAASSPQGRPLITIQRARLAACCRKTSFFTRPAGHAARGSGALGLMQALSRPLRLSLNGRAVDLAPGEAFVVNRGDATPLVDDGRFPKHFRHIVIAPSALDRFFSISGLEHAKRRFVFDPVGRPLSPDIVAAILGLEELLRHPQGPAGKAHLEACLHSYLFSLLKRFPNRIARASRENSLGGLPDPRLARAVAYLQREYARPYNRSLVAQYACVSRQRLQELFRRHLHQDPRNYLIRIRMEKAKALLASGKRSLAKVGRAVGYADPRSFRRLYQRYAQEPSAPR